MELSHEKLENPGEANADEDEEGERGEEEETVGYGRPPKRSQWKPGTSGNFKGRPRNAKGRRQTLMRIANEYCEAVIDGKVATLTKATLALLAVRNATANGDPAGQKLFDRLLREQRDEGPPIPKGTLILEEVLTEEEWVAIFGHG